MIYPQHVFVALASLTSLVSAAPVNKRETGLVGVEPISLLNPSDYSTECYNAWTAFDHGRCWCHTGCALDCTNDGVPGKAGSVIHPEWCEESMHLTRDACESITVSLTEACAKFMDDKSKAPGLADVCETAGYDACTPKKSFKEFELGGVAKTCEDLGAKTITNAADCETASVPGVTTGSTGGKTGYGGEGDWCGTTRAPDGCYHTSGFWFNRQTCTEKDGIKDSYLNGIWDGKPLRIVCIA